MILQPLFYLRFSSNLKGEKMELHNIRDEYTKRVLSQNDCHSNWCEMVSHCGFALHFSNEQ